MLTTVAPGSASGTIAPRRLLGRGSWPDRPAVLADLAAHRAAIVSTTSMWTYVETRLTPGFAITRIDRMHDDTVPAMHGIDTEYAHRATGETGTLALRSLPYFPPRDAPLLAAAGLGSTAARRLQMRATAGKRAGVLLRVGMDRWYYWRALSAESWPYDVRSWPADQAIRATNGKWEGVAFDGEMLAQCLITHDGYPY